MTAPQVCFMYSEDQYFPHLGEGLCLVEHDEKGVCMKCADVIHRCQRKHLSPYLKDGEKS